MSYYQFKYTVETLVTQHEELSRRVLGQEEGDEVVLVAESPAYGQSYCRPTSGMKSRLRTINHKFANARDVIRHSYNFDKH